MLVEINALSKMYFNVCVNSNRINKRKMNFHKFAAY